MPDSSSPNESAAQLLKSAAILFSALGAAFLAWLGVQWQKYPELRASQFGFEAPLWPALGGFVLLAVIAVVSLFWTAARRVEAGEDLFARRHRRQSSEWDRPSNGQVSEYSE
ncbi:MAG: ABC transporter permease [Bacteroidetes bacterium SW_9_63_38]|nr:MAG: ABC transporter permease [Bacteroidetes bacterium SW_9_63_38]